MKPFSQKALATASLIEQVARDVYDERGPKAVHPVQWSALRFFDRAGTKARTVSGLGKYLGVTIGPSSRAAAALVRRGLITKIPSPDDQRSSLFELTKEGRDLLKTDPLYDLAAVISGLGEQEDRFSKTILGLSENLAKSRAPVLPE